MEIKTIHIRLIYEWNAQNNSSVCFVFCCVLFGFVWFGLVWFGLVWFGLVWFGFGFGFGFCFGLFALLCLALLCFALLCFALLCFALLCCATGSVTLCNLYSSLNSNWHHGPDWPWTHNNLTSASQAWDCMC